MRFRNPHALLASEINLDVGFRTAAALTRHCNRGDRYASSSSVVPPGIKKPGSVHSSWNVASPGQRAVISAVRQAKRTLCNASTWSTGQRRARTHVKSTSSDVNAAIYGDGSFDSCVFRHIWKTNGLSKCAQCIDAFTDGLFKPDDAAGSCGSYDLASSSEALE